MADFKTILKKAREAKKLSQTQVANLLGVKLRTYQYYEEGRNEPKRAALNILIKELGIDPALLYEHKIRIEDILVTETNPSYSKSKKQKSEVKQVPFDDFMEVKYLPRVAQAGYLTRYEDVDGEADKSLDSILVPREFEKGNYLVIEVDGQSMNDGSDRSINDGDKLLIKELDPSLWKNTKVYYRDYLFVIMSKEHGAVVKQIISHDVEKGLITCHSRNPLFKDFNVHVSEIFRLFYVKKIVDRKIKF